MERRLIATKTQMLMVIVVALDDIEVYFADSVQTGLPIYRRQLRLMPFGVLVRINVGQVVLFNQRI